MLFILDYCTCWSLIISFFIFIVSCFKKIPLWLFLYAACILSVCSIVGTFYLTLPSLDKKSNVNKVYPHIIILIDSILHLIPLIILLCLFKYLKKNTYGGVNVNYTMFLTVITFIIYLFYNQFNFIYDGYNCFFLFILCISIFIFTYKIYTS
jgi:hypothetical protein